MRLEYWLVLFLTLTSVYIQAEDACFSYSPGKSGIMNLPQHPEDSRPPDYWFFGKFSLENESLSVQQCRDLCAQEPLCWLFTYHFSNSSDAWRNRCFGRSNKYAIWTDNTALASGERIPCSQVCMGSPSLHGNAVFRLIESPEEEDRPKTYYFGNWYLTYGTEEIAREKCRLACAVERMCWAYSLFPERHIDEGKRGHCYGAGSQLYDTIVDEPNVISGARIACRERCFSTAANIDPLKGLVSAPEQSNPPATFYFGNTANDPNKCESRCQDEPDCAGFVHYGEDYSDDAWRGGCYGRDATTVGHHNSQGSVGGRHRPCEEVCWHQYANVNTVKGLVTSPGYEDRPNVYFFGDHFDDDYDACANACAFTNGCDAYALFSSSYPAPEYRGHCYGRGLQSTMQEQEENVHGGTRKTCQMVCMDDEVGHSTVKGLVAEAGTDNRPETFFFGDFHDDVERCKRACLLEPQCYSYTLFSNSHLDPAWRGLCYGRNLYNQLNEEEEHTVSGYQYSCAPVCMDRVSDRNTLNSLVGVKQQDRPYTFYFGDFGSNVDRCEHACLMEPLCHTYTLHLRELGGPYAGLCYGRSASYDTAVTQLLHVSGIKEPCTNKCFDRVQNRKTVVVSYPGNCSPPQTMCYGNMGKNEEMCKAACYADPHCASYSYFTELYPSTIWRGECIGRNSDQEPEEEEKEVFSGKQRACTPVCYDYEMHRNTMHGLVETPGDEDRPRIFYFGHVGDDVDKCRRLCEVERDCFSYTLHFTNFSGAAWAGQCYGRNTEDWVDVEEQNVVSGVRKPCGPVSYDIEPGRSTVHGLVDYPGHEYRPDVMYFGKFGDDLTKCRQACAGEPLCNSYSLYLPEYGNGWEGMCYGRSSFAATAEAQEHVVSGVKVPAAPICFSEELNMNTVHSSVPTVGWEDRPVTFYFGLYGDDKDRCRQACAAEPRCHSWTLHFTNLSNAFAGHCYGRGSFSARSEFELNTISGTRQQCNHVCFDRHQNKNSMYYLISQPGQDNPPHIFYFGYFGNDVDQCEAACAGHPSCYSWLLHLQELNSPWSGHCYGRDAFHEVLADEENTVSGIRKSCTEVCFDEKTSTNTVWGIIAQAEFEDRPRTFYFGKFGDDVDRCRRACEVEPYCESYSLHLTSFPSERWKGQCYGRGNFDDVAVSENHVTSGLKKPCKKTCFSELPNHNTVWGLIPSASAGLDEGRPEVMYLGKFDDNDVERCKHACAVEPNCSSYSLHLSTHAGIQWRGTCYGRSEAFQVEETEDDVISGYTKACNGNALSGGAIFGIVVAVLVVLAVVAFLVVSIMQGRSQGATPNEAIGASLRTAGLAVRARVEGAWDKFGSAPSDVSDDVQAGFDNKLYEDVSNAKREDKQTADSDA